MSKEQDLRTGGCAPAAATGWRSRCDAISTAAPVARSETRRPARRHWCWSGDGGPSTRHPLHPCESRQTEKGQGTTRRGGSAFAAAQTRRKSPHWPHAGRSTVDIELRGLRSRSTLNWRLGVAPNRPSSKLVDVRRPKRLTQIKMWLQKKRALAHHFVSKRQPKMRQKNLKENQTKQDKVFQKK